MPWYPFCCTPAAYLNDFSAKPETIVEVSGTWTYGDASPYGVFISSSNAAILSYSCEVNGSPLVKLKLRTQPTNGNGVRVYLRASADFSTYFCAEITNLGEVGSAGRGCANVRLYTSSDGVILSTIITKNALIADTSLSVGLDLSRPDDPRFVCTYATISIGDLFPDGFAGYGHFVGFGTSLGNTDTIKIYDVEIKSYSGDCCGSMSNPLVCYEGNPCGGDGVGGTTPLHSGITLSPANQVGYWWAYNATETDWWNFIYDGSLTATFSIPSDRCGVTPSAGKCSVVESVFRVVPSEESDPNCVAYDWTLSLGINSVQDALGAISSITVAIISDSCKSTGTVSHTSTLTHTGGGTALIGSDIDGVCLDSESSMCSQLGSESLLTSISPFPLGFVRIRITVVYDDGFVCRPSIGADELLYQARGDFTAIIAPAGNIKLLPIETC